MTALMQLIPAEDIAKMVRDAVRAELGPVIEALGPVAQNAGWMTVAEAAAQNGRTSSTINRWVREGSWEAEGAGANRRVRRKEV